MNILFILYNNFISNSAIHVHNFANALSESGHDCIVTAKSHKDILNQYVDDQIDYKAIEFHDIHKNSIEFKDKREPDIIHAWTPREAVRHQLNEFKKKFTSSRLIVHLEDNEDAILKNSTKIPFTILKYLPYFLLKKFFSDQFSHPRHYKQLLESADGITLIMDTLAEFVPKDKPSIVLWPIIRPEKYTIDFDQIKRKENFNIGKEDLVVAYTGNVHKSNIKEIRTLYLSIGHANRSGLPVKLIRTGKDYCTLLRPDEEWVKKYSIELGFVKRDELLSCMAIADLLIQPGKPGLFNDYRLPSKIPEFLSIGKPVVLPNSNIARFLKNEEEAVVLQHGDIQELYNILKMFHGNKKLIEKLSTGGRQFALKNFNKDIITQKLENFYRTILEAQ